MKKLSLLFTLALATATVTGCDAFSFINGGTTPEPEGGEVTPTKPDEGKKEDDPEEILIEYILLESDSETLEIGDTYQIDYDVYPHGAYNEVSFDSSNTSVATVSVNGLVEAKAEGNSVITLTSIQDTSVTAELSIAVNPAPISNYTVTFNANNGTGTMANDTTTGSTYITPECTFERTNYTFDGWALNSVGGTRYGVGATITGITSNITLYALWRDNTQPITNYNVTFDKNGADGAETMAAAQTTGSTYTTPVCEFTYTNHTFKHWALDSVSGTTFIAGTQITGISSDITLYAIWEENSSGGDDYYDGITAAGGTSLLGQLHDLSVTKHTFYNKYSTNENDGKNAVTPTNCIKTDPYGSGNYVMDFYSGAPVKNTSVSGGDGTSGWNREHVWCKSLSNGLFSDVSSTSTGAGADIQHIRPTIPAINSARGNKPYGELNDSGTQATSIDVNGNTVLGGYYSGNVFQPLANRKGDCARIVMYLYMHYNPYSRVGGTTDGSANTKDLYFTSIMAPSTESAAIQLLLTWNAADPVDEIERTRNVEAAKITGCKNPFIDHPEYADLIWGN